MGKKAFGGKRPRGMSRRKNFKEVREDAKQEKTVVKRLSDDPRHPDNKEKK